MLHVVSPGKCRYVLKKKKKDVILFFYGAAKQGAGLGNRVFIQMVLLLELPEQDTCGASLYHSPPFHPLAHQFDETMKP